METTNLIRSLFWVSQSEETQASQNIPNLEIERLVSLSPCEAKAFQYLTDFHARYNTAPSYQTTLKWAESQKEHLLTKLIEDSSLETPIFGADFSEAVEREIRSQFTHHLVSVAKEAVSISKGESDLPGNPKGPEEAYRYMCVESEKAIEQARAKQDNYPSFNMEDFMARQLPIDEPIMGELLKQKHILELYSWRGAGKTMLGLGLGLSIASASEFLRWKSIVPRKVLYLDGEMSGSELQDRLKGLLRGLSHPLDPDFFYPVNMDSNPDFPPIYIDREKGQRTVMNLIKKVGAEVIIFDNLSCLAPIAENDDVAWLKVSSFLLDLRRKGLTSVVLHHAGKSGAQRGVSRREDPFNTVVKISNPDGYNPEEGFHVIWTIEKNRQLRGAQAGKMDITLTEVQGGLTFSWIPVGKSNKPLDTIDAAIEKLEKYIESQESNAIPFSKAEEMLRGWGLGRDEARDIIPASFQVDEPSQRGKTRWVRKRETSSLEVEDLVA